MPRSFRDVPRLHGLTSFRVWCGFEKGESVTAHSGAGPVHEAVKATRTRHEERSSTMIRSLLLSTVLFLLPFVVYFVWLGRQRRADAEEAVYRHKHLFWVGVFGLGLAVTGFLVFTEFGGAPPDQIYIPPRTENGKLIPGHFAPRTEAP